MSKKVFITGGGGYVGSALADKLVEKGYRVTVLDLFLYGKNVFNHPKRINLVKGDIRNEKILKKSIAGHDTVIHLACISNDPSFDLNPDLGKSVNLDSFEPLIKISKDAGVKKFIYASTSSVYGIKKESEVTEKMKLEPLTDYSKYKAMCEDICLKYNSKSFKIIILRPATVCGYSNRQRFDLVVNILTNLGFNKRTITVFGGAQLRPNIHIQDMVSAYLCSMENDKIFQKTENIYNVGFENFPTLKLAEMVKSNLGADINLKIEKTTDERSYHISSKKFSEVTNFEYSKNINDAISELKFAFENKKFINPLTNKLYFNIKMMNSVELK